MASMRVHELAKEFDMTSKELLDKLNEMKIPAKSHASMLADAYVAKIRKNLEPEIKQRAGQLEAEEAAELARERAEAEARKAEEERARREAVEQERAAREAERARREAAEAEGGEQGGEGSQDGRKPAKAPASSPFESLASQIESEKERVAREAAEARARARQAKAMAEVAKKQAVEEALRQRNSKKQKGSASSAPKPAPVIGAKKASGFDSLLSQIEAEKQRIEAQKKQAASAGAGAKDAARKGGKPERGPKKGKRGGSFEQIVPELEVQQQPAGEDRYAQMAVQAEKLQRDKVLAEARAAVAAASTHEGEGRRKKRKEKREAENRERLEMEAIEKGLDPTLVLDDSVVEIPQGATVAKFAELIGVQPNDVIKRLFMLGQVLTLTQSMGDDLVELIADDMGRKVRVVSPEEEYAVVYHDKDEDLKPRPPVVTVMGHVDHGKTSLLDAIRDTGVAAGEAGGITQHIGAYQVNVQGKTITFLDTPGHEAFTAMRARGAMITDVAILVVAADDGIMPQTVESINHAKAANIPIIVAINKMDKPEANPERIKEQLTKYELVPEEWGGETIICPISAKTGEGIDNLLEMVNLTAEMQELKANPNRSAHGAVIEARLDKGRGPVATLLVQNGTLKQGDVIIAGTAVGRVRAMTSAKGEKLTEAGPSVPVEIIGMGEVPGAGDDFHAVADERMARELVEQRKHEQKMAASAPVGKVSLEDLFSQIKQGEMKDLNIIVKADVQGSAEAVKASLEKLSNEEVRVRVIHCAVGAISESDVMLATTSNAIIVGFNVRPDNNAKESAARNNVDMRMYRVIYDCINEIETAMKGMLAPKFKEVELGQAEVRNVFRITGVGMVAGCYVTNGKMQRGAQMRLLRDNIVIYDGAIASLQRFKDSVKEVAQGYECGITFEKFQDIKEGDVIEAYLMEQIEV